MSKLWGPLGWMTLHSVSLIYPEQPTADEKYIANRFLDLFSETISCNECKSHFKTMYSLYKAMHPEFLNSRQDFAVFIFRAHNTVNLRLDKPRPSTMVECLATLSEATKQTSLAAFRTSYLSYLLRIWGRQVSGEGMIIKSHVKEMIKINNEYWSPREIPIPELIEADVMIPIQKETLRVNFRGVAISSAVGFKGGRLKLGRS
jgi:hypothetical protein